MHPHLLEKGDDLFQQFVSRWLLAEHNCLNLRVAGEHQPLRKVTDSDDSGQHTLRLLGLILDDVELVLLLFGQLEESIGDGLERVLHERHNVLGLLQLVLRWLKAVAEMEHVSVVHFALRGGAVTAGLRRGRLLVVRVIVAK